MKFNLYLISLLVFALTSCDKEPTAPESDCHILQSYKLGYHAVMTSNVFNIRTDPPSRIKKLGLENGLSYQLIRLHNDDPVPYPYSEYFIDSISFESPTKAEVRIFEINTSREYDYERNDCQIEMESIDGNLHFELFKSGDEISEKRFAIYDHQMSSSHIDTFLFIEFRLGHFSSYEEIINQFAKDNAGKYDTIAIELVQNRTKE